MKSFIKNFDFFSNEIKLTINNNQTRYRNLFGGTLGIMTLLSVFALFAYFLRQFINGEGQTVISNLQATSEVSLNMTRVPFMLRITDTNSKVLPDKEKVWGIKMKYWEGQVDETGAVTQKSVNVQVEKCDIKKHFGEYEHLFLNFTDIDTFFCPVLRPENYTVYGIYGDVKPFSYYHFYIHMCLNNSLGMDCQTMDYIKKQLANPFLEMRTLDYNIDNFATQPNQVYVRSDRHVISYTVYKRIWMYLRNVDYLSDFGLVFQTEVKDQFYLVDSFRYDTDLRDIMTGSSTPGSFTTFTVLNSQQKITYFRAYMKAQNFLANVGGMLKGIMTIAIIINYFIAQRLYYRKLINSTSDFFDDEDEPDKKNDIRISNRVRMINQISIPQYTTKSYNPVETKMSKPSLNHSPNRLVSRLNERYTNIESIPQLKKKFEKKRTKILFHAYQYLCPIYCLKNEKKKQLFLKRMKQVDNRMSIIYMINLFNEFEKLKDLVLSPEQRILFTLLPTKNKGEIKKIVNNEVDLVRSYNKINTKINKNDIDNKILNLING